LAEIAVLIAALAGWAVLALVPHPLAVLFPLAVAFVGVVWLAATI
jgi:hypothetical protein